MTEKYSSIPLLKISVANDLKSSCAGDNFDEFAGDDGLAGAVESDGQFVDHLLGVLASVIHGAHASGLFRAGALL